MNVAFYQFNAYVEENRLERGKLNRYLDGEVFKGCLLIYSPSGAKVDI